MPAAPRALALLFGRDAGDAGRLRRTGVGAEAAPAGAGSALAQLVRQTNALPRAQRRRQRRKLRRAARRPARRAQAAVHVGPAARAFRRVLRGIKVKKGRRNRRGKNRLTALGPASMAASRALLASRRTRRCGGGVKPSKLEDGEHGSSRTTRTACGCASSCRRCGSSTPRAAGARGPSSCCRTRTRRREPGSPGIPVVSNTLGVPEGATLKVEATGTTSYTIERRRRVPRPARAGRPGPPSRRQPGTLRRRRPFLLDADEYRERGKPARRGGGRQDPRPVARHHARQPAGPGGAVRRARRSG